MSVCASTKQHGAFYTSFYVFDVRQARPKCAIVLSVFVFFFFLSMRGAVLMAICGALVLCLDCPIRNVCLFTLFCVLFVAAVATSLAAVAPSSFLLTDGCALSLVAIACALMYTHTRTYIHYIYIYI